MSIFEYVDLGMIYGYDLWTTSCQHEIEITFPEDQGIYGMVTSTANAGRQPLPAYPVDVATPLDMLTISTSFGNTDQHKYLSLNFPASSPLGVAPQ